MINLRSFLVVAPTLTAAQLRVAVVYLLRASEQGMAWTCNLRLEKETGLHRRDVQRARQDLIDKGILAPAGHVKEVPRYKVLLPTPTPPISESKSDPAYKGTPPTHPTQNQIALNPQEGIEKQSSDQIRWMDDADDGARLGGGAASAMIDEETEQPQHALVSALIEKGVAINIAREVVAYQEARQWLTSTGEAIKNHFAACCALAGRWRPQKPKVLDYPCPGDNGKAGAAIGASGAPFFPSYATTAGEWLKTAWAECVEVTNAEAQDRKRALTTDDLAFEFLHCPCMEEKRAAGNVNFAACLWAVKELAKCYAVQFDAEEWREALTCVRDADRRALIAAPEPTAAQPADEQAAPQMTKQELADVLAAFQAHRAPQPGDDHGNSLS